tara:strand:+ start:2636 stop:3484 length:849 start_codon:yes stop_codon:yes gene_type:complete
MLETETKHIADSCAILAVYNDDKLDWLKKAISSIDLKIIKKIYIGVDGPIDLEINLYLNRLDEKFFRIIKFKENRGLAHVLNDLIHLAINSSCKYDLFFRIDADDINLKNRFRSQFDFLLSNPNIDVLGGGAILVDENENEIGSLFKLNNHENLLKRFPYDSPLIHPTVVFRRKILLNNIYPTDTIRSEDLALWAKLILQNRQFANLEEPLIKHRITNGTIIRRSGLRKSFNELKIRLIFLIKFGKFFSINTVLTLGLFFSKIFLPNFFLKYLFLLRINYFR